MFCNEALLGNDAMKNKAVFNIGCNKRSNSKSVFGKYIYTMGLLEERCYWQYCKIMKRIAWGKERRDCKNLRHLELATQFVIVYSGYY